ncbi:hypothetical protein ACFVW9_10670 [Streptomyces sp. NPDC058217]|uniref:hypothetical protein n=1 Tax=Streptomyces sp. NPDC058217 TaxID=3346384 RepID=UPI0036E6FB4D
MTLIGPISALHRRATAQDIAGGSKMSRDELTHALARAGHRRNKSAARPPPPRPPSRSARARPAVSF